MSENTSETIAIVDARIVRPEQGIQSGSILIQGNKIQQILAQPNPRLPREIKKIKAYNHFVCPGFIDLHVHGAGGFHFLDKPYRNIYQIIKTLQRFGTTSLLPTLSAAGTQEILAYIKFIKKEISSHRLPRSVLGLNLEGPFLSIGKRGAQPLRALRSPNLPILNAILEEADGLIKVMTLAPELKGALGLVKRLKQKDIIPAIGHTQADYEIARESLKAGISYATHFFNSYPPLHHRQPGPLAAILEDENIDLELIADGIHVSPVMIKLLFKLKEFERILLVTDGTAALGTKIKNFSMGGRKVSLESGRVCLQDGTLVGSVISLNQALHNIIKYTGISFERALALVTLHPAKKLGIMNKKGDLGKGMDADLVILDRNFEVQQTIVAGKVVYKRRQSPKGKDKK